MSSTQLSQPSVILQLTPAELRCSASRWTARHLKAYRVLKRPERAFLQSLQTLHAEFCPLRGHAKQSPPQQVNQTLIDTLLEQVAARNFVNSSASELMKLPTGDFLVALARASNPMPEPSPHLRPLRPSQPVRRTDAAGSSTDIATSSSPLQQPSLSDFEPDLLVLDEDENEEHRSKPEEVALTLLISFLQCALQLCLIQLPDLPHEIRPRIERKSAQASIAGGDRIFSEDDGGIAKYGRQRVGWTILHPYLALLEAKRAFKYIRVDDRTGISSPIVSDNTIAQYFCEALLAWRANQSLLGNMLVESSGLVII